MTSSAQSHALSVVDRLMPALSSSASMIFEYGETAWREYRSAEHYVQILENNGFDVEVGSAGMPTAFCANWSNGPGPAIGLYAEYDGIPGNCQAPVPHQAPRHNLSVHAGGHTDPHSALGVAGLGALLAIKSTMIERGIGGSLRFTGEPAEKVRGSKPIHAAQGYYDGLDAILSFHPFYMLPMCNTVRLETHCGAAYALIYRFICDEPELWGVSDGAPIPQAHSAIRAPGANDALMLMYMSSKSLRDSMLPHQGGWSISEAILTAGQATADNLPAGLAEIQYMIRVPTVAMAEQVVAVLNRNAQAAAAMSGCRWERRWVSKSRPGLPNTALAQTVWQSLQAVGAPAWDEEARAIARKVQENCGIEATDNPFIDECERLMDPAEAEAILRRDLPPSQKNSTSDDYTDMSWHAPLARFYIARPTLRGPVGFRFPAWAMNALGGIPQTIDPMIRTAAKVLAHAGVRILEDETVRADARREFNERTGGGINGSQWLEPLCDYPPPTGFRWPEYIQTSRGHEWWIPS